MTLGPTREGSAVITVGHVAADLARLASDMVDTALSERVVPVLADLSPRVVALARSRFRVAHLLINNARSSFTPELYRRPSAALLGEAIDEIVQTVVNADYPTADQLARVAAEMVTQGRGRVVNVTPSSTPRTPRPVISGAFAIEIRGACATGADAS